MMVKWARREGAWTCLGANMGTKKGDAGNLGEQVVRA
jgi:hypothetical protein